MYAIAVSEPSGDDITVVVVGEHCAMSIHQIKWLYHILAFTQFSEYVLIVPTIRVFILMDSGASLEYKNAQEIGLGLTGFGIFFSFLGIIFFFDEGLLAMGNILSVSGVSLTIGLKSTMQLFMKPSNFKGTLSFAIGFFILIIGWPILGMIVEAYGFIVLFRRYPFLVGLVNSHMFDRSMVCPETFNTSASNKAQQFKSLISKCCLSWCHCCFPCSQRQGKEPGAIADPVE